MITGSADLPLFLKSLEGWMSGSGIHFRSVKNKETEMYIIQHELGQNAAYYITGFLKRALQFMKAKDIVAKSTSDTLWVEFTR